MSSMQCSENIFCTLGKAAEQKNWAKQREKLECYISEENFSPTIGNIAFW